MITVKVAALLRTRSSAVLDADWTVKHLPVNELRNTTTPAAGGVVTARANVLKP